jgi:hypothetical protein
MFRKMKWLMEGAGGGAGGSGAPDWRAALPEALRADPSLASFSDLGALAKSFIETKSLVGKSIRPPGPDAAPEAKKEFVKRLLEIEPALIYAPDGDPEVTNRLWKKLGRPEKPDEYVLSKQAEEAGLDMNDLRALAVKGGLTKGQFDGLVELMTQAKLEEGRQAALERVALETEWGATKEERTLAAKAAALKMGLTEPEVNALTPKMLKAFAAVAKAVGVSAGEFRKQGDGAPAPVDPSEALRQMAEIRAHPAYFDASKDPVEHKRLVAKMSKLAEQAYR